MRMWPVGRDELKDNFEAAIVAAEKGQAPKTSQGFNGPVFDALWLLSSATEAQRASRSAAARRAFADQLLGTVDGIDGLLKG